MYYKNFIKLFLSIILICSQGKTESSDQAVLSDFRDLKKSLNLAMTLQTSSDDYEKISQQISNFEKNHASEISQNSILQSNIRKLKKVNDLQKKLAICLKEFNSESSIGKKIISSLSQNVELFEEQIASCSAQSPIADVKSISKQIILNNKKNLLADYIDKVKNNAQINIKKMNEAVPDNEISFKTGATQLNSNVESINEMIERPITGRETKDRENMAVENLKLIQNTFWQQNSSGVGLLMHMPTIKSKTGEIESEAEIKYTGMTRAQRGVAHLDQDLLKANISSNDIKAAKKEYLGQMDEVINDMNQKSHFSDKEVDSYLVDLIQDHPLMAGQMLLDDPSKASLFCDLFNQVDKKNKDEAGVKKIRNVSLMVVGGVLAVGGGVLTLTGVGSVAGVPLSYVGASVAAAGAVVTATEVGFSINDYQEAQKDLNQVVSSSLVNAQSSQTFYQKEYFEKKAEVSSHAREAAIALGTSAVGGVGAVRGAYKFGKYMKMDEIGKMKSLYPKQLSSYINVVGEKRYAELMGSLSTLDKEVQREALQLLAQKAESDPSGAKKLFEQIESHLSKSCKK